uniref:YY1 associated protein 1 n=1 Tax=Rhinopithecus bieti TaxID=61621 RepID=A0A2K6KW58_RHIBE
RGTVGKNVGGALGALRSLHLEERLPPLCCRRRHFGFTISVSVAGPASPQFAPFSLHLSLLLSRISASQLTRWPPPDKREGSAVDPGKRRSLAATPSSPLPCTLVALGFGLRHEKEANELMEDLFETFQDEMGFSNMEDDGPEEEERVAEPRPNFNTPQALRAMTRSQLTESSSSRHVQLLTQIHLLATCNPNLNPEASSTRICLKELGTFAQSSIALHHQYNPKFQTLFQPCNLMGAMQLIEDFSTHVSIDCSPHKTVKKTGRRQMYHLLVCSGILDILLTDDSVSRRNVTHAHFFHVKFYKKTKQLPVLVKCCEEIQPHQWKPPVDREEHRLPFWLKASLPSIQEELRHMADGAREVGHLESETRYPLLLPKGVVLKLKPVANRFPRKAWRQKRSSVLKPLLIQPSPSLQPSFNPGKTPAQSTHSEAPPSKMVVRIPHPIQPATVLQTVPGVPPLGSVEVRVLRQDKLPSTETLKRRGARAFRCIKPAPVIHPASVIFTVPAT